MTNAPFDRIEDYQDIQTINMYHKRVFEMGRNREEVMASIMAKSRDHARTPMQWDGSKNAGFTEGEPWLAVNPNYKTVNAAEAQDDPDSILNFYKKLIRLRKQYADIIKGSYTLLLPDDPQLFVYERQANGQKLMSISNVSKEEAAFYWPDGSEPERAELLLSNYDNDSGTESRITFRPYETRVYLLA